MSARAGHGLVAYDPVVAGAIEDFIEDVKRYIAAGDRLAAGIASYNLLNAQGIEDLTHGLSMRELFRKGDSAAWSRAVTRLLDDFEECRRAVRRSATIALIDEGLTVAQVGAAFGVSRQLADRFARETGHR